MRYVLAGFGAALLPYARSAFSTLHQTLYFPLPKLLNVEHLAKYCVSHLDTLSLRASFYGIAAASEDAGQ